MNGQTKTAKIDNIAMSLLLTGALFVFASASAQVPVDEDGNTLPANAIDNVATVSEATPAVAGDSVLSSTELEALVGPIALYPDDLLAIVLPASTYPLEVVQAARFLEQLESDSSLEPNDDWDDSVVALLNYPEVVRMMDNDIDWTWRLGEAVLSQQSEVIAAVEAFRDRAYAAGNLKTDENQTVTYDQGGISIEPADEEIIYVPYYEPEEVVVYQPRRVYHYYPDPYPVYYYPYPVGYSFRSGYFWGVTTAFSIGWHNHYLSVYHPTYWGHPYYGRSYYGHYYRYPSVNVYNSYYVNNNYRNSTTHYRDGDYWRPRTRAGSRQDEPRVRNYHYPPGGDQRRRSDTSSRSQFSNRDNGRLALDMRERSTADRSRVGISRDGRATIDGRAAVSSDGNRRSTNTSRNSGDAATRRSGNRTSANTSAPPRVNGNRDRVSTNSNRNSADTATQRSGNRTTTNSTAPPRVNNSRERASTGNTRTEQNSSRTPNPRAEIQFRDRSATSGTGASGARTNQARPSAAARQSTSGNASSFRSDRSLATPQRVSPTARATTPRSTNTPTFRQRSPSSASAPRATTPRSSAPSNRQSSPAPRATSPSVRQSARAPRSSAPRASAPSYRSSAPAPRASAPRSSAPRTSAPRSSAPRTSAPRASAPRSSAPRSSAPSSSSSRAPASGSSSSRSSGSRSSSSSRARNRSN